jgi:hypothetical protein
VTNTERIVRLEEAIKELHDVLEAVFDREWVEDSKVKAIVDSEEGS